MVIVSVCVCVRGVHTSMCVMSLCMCLHAWMLYCNVCVCVCSSNISMNILSSGEAVWCINSAGVVLTTGSSQLLHPGECFHAVAVV